MSVLSGGRQTLLGEGLLYCGIHVGTVQKLIFYDFIGNLHVHIYIYVYACIFMYILCVHGPSPVPARPIYIYIYGLEI